jgi:hypothetical protein
MCFEAHSIFDKALSAMTKELSREDEVLLRLLKTSPTPFMPKAKKKPSPAKSEAKKVPK